MVRIIDFLYIFYIPIFYMGRRPQTLDATFL